MKLSLVILLIISTFVNTQVPPQIPQSPLQRETAEPFKEQNLCAFLKPVGSVGHSFWTCGAPYKQTYCGFETTFEYQCCPGYSKNELVNNECGETKSVWKVLPVHLADYSTPKFAELLKQHAKLPDLFDENGRSTYTVFAPYSDAAMKQDDFDLSSASGDPHPISMHISNNRIYSSDFKNGATFKTSFTDHKLKVTTYSNGLIFIDCRALVNPDHETKNGIIHYISGPIIPHVGSGFQRKTVLQTMQKDPMTYSFYNDIPSEVRTLLDQDRDVQWFTVFAPTNEAWNQVKSKYGEQITQIVKNHILNRMICAKAITRKATSLGPTLAEEYVGVDCSSGGSRSILDACGDEVKIVKEDLVSGNGVVQIIEKVLIPTSVMSATDTISCMSKGTSNPKISKFLQQSRNCDLKIKSNENYLILMPTDEAYDRLKDNPTYNNQNTQMCQDIQYHILKIKNGPLQLINQKSFDTNLNINNKPLSVVSNFIKYRDGSKLFFNSARATEIEPRKFGQGYYFFVDRINIPPTKTMMELISERSDVSLLQNKLQETRYDSQLKSMGHNVLFLAWQNHGWETRKEKKWGLPQLERLFQLHTINMELWGSDIGYFHPETYSTVNSVYQESGKPFPLKIKRELNGNTYIGYEALPFELWSLVIESNLHAVDGMVWIIDWPLRFKD